MPWFLTIFFLSLISFSDLSEARPAKKLPSAVIVGTVYCDTCFQDEFSKGSHFIPGASVAVECKDGDSTQNFFRQEVKTDKHGEFRVDLPFSVSKHVKRIKGCSVKLISSSEPYCAVASTATSSSLRLKSRKQGSHIFSAGFFSFKPLKQPNLCNQKPSLQNSKEVNAKKFEKPTIFPPPIQDPTTPDIPEIPLLPKLPPLPTLPPLLTLPPLPPLPGLPNIPPMPGKMTQSKPDVVQSEKAQSSNQKVAEPETTQSNPDEKFHKAKLSDRKKASNSDVFFPTAPISFPPNPFLPPPILPPNPLQPPSVFPPNPFMPPPILPPNPLLPPPAPLIPLPPIPGLTPPSPPTFPIPLPPFPFPPSPPFPGIPPVASSERASP